MTTDFPLSRAEFRAYLASLPPTHRFGGHESNTTCPVASALRAGPCADACVGTFTWGSDGYGEGRDLPGWATAFIVRWCETPAAATAAECLSLLDSLPAEEEVR